MMEIEPDSRAGTALKADRGESLGVKVLQFPPFLIMEGDERRVAQPPRRRHVVKAIGFKSFAFRLVT
jgi:hypothetical protein